ncbi:MAG TPA: TnsD family transposase [Ktedonobacterales bacterium]|nr:TnsD family transposase [Ktedonobacterales bacterium]
MIGHFPPPHPDELLYSVCARFADQVHYPGTEDVVQNLFGTRRFPGSIHLPVHLDHLVSVITPGHRFTVDQFIDEHTLFPFYAPFLQSEHPSEIRKAMRLSGGTSAQARIGRVAEQHRWPSQLRACPHCVREDRQQFGECYWHRVHQILGVEVCPFHACYLLNSDISTHSRHSFAPISAERAIAENLLLIPGVIENTPLEWQLAIARDAYWLLDQKVESPGLEALARCYRSLLAQQGLATYRGTIRTPKLIAKFSSYYSVEFLRHLRSELKMGERKNWLTSLFQADRLQHPVRHLLLIHFLGYSAETFFTVLLDESPFGKGPWPCLNPVCEHYNQPCIDHCTITYTQSVRHQREIRPKGTFKCICGFCYTRIGPDHLDEHIALPNKVITYGPLWDAALISLWNNPLVGINEVARRLNVNPFTLRIQAARLGLVFPRPASKTSSQEKYLLHPRSAGTADPEKLAKYRKAWLAARKAYPEAGRTFLMKQANAAYQWLLKHDLEWLKSHLPARKPPSTPNTRFDWGNRDVQWANEVEAATLSLKGLSERPIRITRVAIAKVMGIPKSMLSGSLEKLPLTKKVLESSLESIDAFDIRQIRWAAILFQQEHFLPTKTQFLRRSGTWTRRNSPAVQQLSDDALRMLSGEEGIGATGRR